MPGWPTAGRALEVCDQSVPGVVVSEAYPADVTRDVPVWCVLARVLCREMDEHAGPGCGGVVTCVAYVCSSGLVVWEVLLCGGDWWSSGKVRVLCLELLEPQSSCTLFVIPPVVT